jgi:hypothetical protein
MNPKPQPSNHSPPLTKQIYCPVTEAELALFNWVRLKRHPARFHEWMRATLRAAALEQAREQIAAGRPLPQGMAEVLAEVRGTEGG